jgi:hypothetical protein
VQVAALAQQVVAHLAGAQAGDGAGVGQDGAVGAAAQDHAQPGAQKRVDQHGGNVYAAGCHGVQHEAPEEVVAHHADESHAQSQAGCAAGEDRRRSADRQRHAFDQRLLLPKADHQVWIRQDQVGVDLPGDEDIVLADFI